MMEFTHQLIFIKIVLQVVKRLKDCDKKRIEKECDKKTLKKIVIKKIVKRLHGSNKMNLVEM